MYMCVRESICTYMYTLYMYIHTYTYTYMYIHIYLNIYTFTIYIEIYMYMCVCVCIYTYMIFFNLYSSIYMRHATEHSTLAKERHNLRVRNTYV